MPESIAAALIGGAFGAVGTIVTLWATRAVRLSEVQENNADTAARIAEAWQSLIEPLERRVNALERENTGLKARIQELEADNLKKAALIIEMDAELNDLRKKFGRQARNEKIG